MPVAVLAQAPGVPVYREGPEADPEGAVRKQAQFERKRGGLLPASQVSEQVVRNKACTLKLPAAGTEKLEMRELWRRARNAHIRVGWFYLCNDCNKWHVELSGGYAIASDAVATCAHVVGDGKDADMREGYLIAVDEDDNLLPVTAVLAMNMATDTAIVRVATDKLQPLPLGKDVVPGDSILCFSDPLERRGMLTTGIVSRFMQRPFLRDEELTEEEKANPHLIEQPVFVQVTADWAPGSSGSAVLDMCGNAIGHVSEVQTELEESESVPTDKKGGKDNDDPPQLPGTVIVFHDAIAAGNVQALIKGSTPALVKAGKGSRTAAR